MDVLSEVIKPECPVERIGAKKANQLAHRKDFIKLTGEKEEKAEEVEIDNKYVGFRGQRYNVIESIGFVEIVVEKKMPRSYTFGVRTVDAGSAVPGKHYLEFDETYTMN